LNFLSGPGHANIYMPTLNFVDYKKKKDRNETEHEERSNKSEKIFLYPSDRFFSQFTNFFFLEVG